MGVWGLVLLGVVQGISEFLPISSSGHLLILGAILGIGDSLFVSILLHFATLLAIFVVFRREIWRMIRHPFSKESISLCLATIPTCVIALILMPLVKRSFEGEYLYICFLISAGILLFVNFYSKKHQSKTFTLKNCVIMGIAQGLAVFPGVSRSGTTISAGVLSGGDREECGRFSFLLSIPIILASMLGEVLQICMGGVDISLPPLGLVLGFIVAFLTGLASIKFTLKLTQKGSFIPVSIYLVFMSVLAFIVM